MSRWTVLLGVLFFIIAPPLLMGAPPDFLESKHPSVTDPQGVSGPIEPPDMMISPQPGLPGTPYDPAVDGTWSGVNPPCGYGASSIYDPVGNRMIV